MVARRAVGSFGRESVGISIERSPSPFRAWTVRFLDLRPLVFDRDDEIPEHGLVGVE